MQLFAAIVPPRDVLDAVSSVVSSVRPDGAAGGESRKGLRGRFGSGGQAPDAGPEPGGVTHGQLSTVAVEEMYIPVTGFGNVTLGDSVKLANAFRAEASTWTCPTLHLAGGAALEWRGDESVWAKLGGDLDALNEIGRGVPQIVQRLGFFVDRRQFRSWLAVGTITDATTAPYLEALVAALEEFEGREWTQESLDLMKRVPDSEPGPSFQVMERFPLATP